MDLDEILPGLHAGYDCAKLQTNDIQAFGHRLFSRPVARLVCYHCGVDSARSSAREGYDGAAIATAYITISCIVVPYPPGPP